MRRTFMREMFRRQAYKDGVKPSKRVRDEWNDYETAKFGLTGRIVHQACGTKPKRLWKSRIQSAL